MEIIRYFKWESPDEMVGDPEEWAAFTSLKSIWNSRHFLTDAEQEVLQQVLSRVPIPVIRLTELLNVEHTMLKRISSICTEFEKTELREDKYRFILVSPICSSKPYPEMIGYLRGLESGLREKWSIVNAFLRKVIQLAEI